MPFIHHDDDDEDEFSEEGRDGFPGCAAFVLVLLGIIVAVAYFVGTSVPPVMHH